LWTTLPGNYHFPGKIVWALVLVFCSFLDGPPKKVGYAKLISSVCFFASACACAYLFGWDSRKDSGLSVVLYFWPSCLAATKSKGHKFIWQKHWSSRRSRKKVLQTGILMSI